MERALSTKSIVDGAIEEVKSKFSKNKFYDTVDQENASIVTNSSDVEMIAFRRICGTFINDHRVQNTMILFIVINAAMMGLATYPFVRLDPIMRGIFNTVDNAFLIIFTIEVGLQFIYRGLYLFTDAWLTFDLFIIVLSWAFGSVQIIRAFRIFRALRLAGRVKPLRDVIQAIMTVLPKLVYIFALLIIVYYISTVVFTSFYKDMYKLGQTEDDFFSRLDVTAFTLFQIMCLDDWSQIAREVMDTHKTAWIPFTLYVLITAFVIVNMIIAVLCDTICELRESEELEDESIEATDIDIPLTAIEKDVQHLERYMENVITSQERTAHMIEFFSRQMRTKPSNFE